MRYDIYNVNFSEQYCETKLGTIDISSQEKLIENLKSINILNNNLIYNIIYKDNYIYIYLNNILLYMLVKNVS